MTILITGANGTVSREVLSSLATRSAAALIQEQRNSAT
jgi:uncharacterized protein YbjT (DUF2867 family)